PERSDDGRPGAERQGREAERFREVCESRHVFPGKRGPGHVRAAVGTGRNSSKPRARLKEKNASKSGLVSDFGGLFLRKDRNFRRRREEWDFSTTNRLPQRPKN